jgi:hypothetical protein
MSVRADVAGPRLAAVVLSSLVALRGRSIVSVDGLRRFVVRLAAAGRR